MPAAFGNMAPIIIKWIPFLKSPIDFGVKVRGKRLFGKNKTWRGLVGAIVLGIVVAYIQKLLFQFDVMKSISIVNYDSISIILLGALLGFGAMVGDLVESFVKRQIDLKPGARLIFWDQTDWVIGSLIFASFYVALTSQIAITAIISFFVLHIIVKHVAYYSGVEDKKW